MLHDLRPEHFFIKLIEKVNLRFVCVYVIVTRTEHSVVVRIALNEELRSFLNKY